MAVYKILSRKYNRNATTSRVNGKIWWFEIWMKKTRDGSILSKCIDVYQYTLHYFLQWGNYSWSICFSREVTKVQNVYSNIFFSRHRSLLLYKCTAMPSLHDRYVTIEKMPQTLKLYGRTLYTFLFLYGLAINVTYAFRGVIRTFSTILIILRLTHSLRYSPRRNMAVGTFNTQAYICRIYHHYLIIVFVKLEEVCIVFLRRNLARIYLACE